MDKVHVGRVEVTVSSRALSVNGQPRHLEPRVFDLLAYLLERRGRVVGTQELIDRLWPDDLGNDNQVARAVMKLRRALADVPPDELRIRTVHRVGYQLMADVRPGAGPDTGPGQPRIRLGLLPFRWTGPAPAHGPWPELALTTLLGLALAEQPGLELMTTTALLDLLGDTQPSAEDPSAGPELVLHGEVRWQGGQWHADYGAHGPRADAVSGHRAHADLPQLARELATAIATQATRPAPAVGRRPDAASALVARGMNALREENWPQATRLLRQALAREAGTADLIGQHAWALAAAHDRAVFAAATQVLDLARQTGRTDLAARANQALAQAHVNLSGVGPRSEAYLKESLKLADQAKDGALVQRLRTLQGHHVTLRGDFRQARDLYSEALAQHEAEGDLAAQAQILNNQAVMDVIDGHLLVARNRLERALRLGRTLGADGILTMAAANLAEVNAELGCIETALEQCDPLLPLISTLSTRAALGLAYTVARVYAEGPWPDRIEAVHRRVQDRDLGTSVPARATALMLAGLRAAASGDRLAAANAMRDAVRGMLDAEEATLVGQWLPIWLRAELRIGHAGGVRAATALAHARSSPGADRALPGAVRHAEAVEWHHRGDAEQAEQALSEALALLPPGRWRAYAQLDWAWLRLERGSLDPQRDLPPDLGPWLEEHPLGWLLRARLRAAQLHPTEARLLMRRVLQRSLPHPALNTLASALEDGTEPPPLATLPSLTLAL